MSLKMHPLPIAAAMLLSSAAAAQAADCGPLRDEAQSAASRNDVARMRALSVPVMACDPQLGDWLNRRLAAALYNAATLATPPDTAMLEASLDYARSWQTLATLGEIARERRNYALAARRFQEALLEISDLQRTPVQPPPETILTLRRRAEEAGLLSPSYVSMPRGRDGSNAGLAASAIRGVKVAAVALPVQFQFGTAEFTDEGRRAVADMAGMLKNEAAAPVTLIGHTDQVGEADFNLQLSRRRAEAVREALRSHGVTRPMVVAGRGEAEPYKPDDPGRYSQAELDQLSRRVELQRR